MKSVVYAKYGSSEVLEIAQIPIPAITENQVLIKVHAVSINPADWHFMRGTPYLMRLQSGLFKPKNGSFALDMAGVVETVGANVTEFKVGDEVYGESRGALSEYAVLSQNSLAMKPANLNYEEAAAVPMAGFTAIQALRDKAGVKAGQRVLIVGASGGVGTFALMKMPCKYSSSALSRWRLCRRDFVEIVWRSRTEAKKRSFCAANPALSCAISKEARK